MTSHDDFYDMNWRFLPNLITTTVCPRDLWPWRWHTRQTKKPWMKWCVPKRLENDRTFYTWTPQTTDNSSNLILGLTIVMDFEVASYKKTIIDCTKQPCLARIASFIIPQLFGVLRVPCLWQGNCGFLCVWNSPHEVVDAGPRMPRMAVFFPWPFTWRT